MILATVRMTIPHKKRDEALRILRSVAEKSKDRSGYLGCDIYGDVQDNKGWSFPVRSVRLKRRGKKRFRPGLNILGIKSNV
jgi:hypothetical protein